MAEIRQATILIRDRQVSGGALPTNALMAEPFVNLHDGVLRFSGVTGGGFEPSDVSSVFEVGSSLYNSKITNRLSINDNFIISGGTGLISTYGGASGAGLDGKFLSGTTSGFVLGNISDIQGVTDITRVQGGTNINTGGTANFPIINLDNDIVLTSVNATSISATTFYSGSTNLEDIFLTSGHLSGTSVSAGANVSVNNVGTDYEVSVVDSPSFNNLTFSGTATGGNASFANMSATTLYSGSTDVDTVIRDIAAEVAGVHTYVAGGTNIVTGGTASLPTISLVDSPSVNILTASGHVLTNGTTYSGGTIVDDGIFTIDAATQVEVNSDLLPAAHLTYDLGAVGQRWDEVFARKVRLGTASTTLEDGLFSSTTGNFLFDFAGDLSIDNNTLPNVHNTYDLGATGTRWKTIYGQDLDLAGALSTTGITDSSLTAGRVVYVGAGGSLTDEAGFEYDEGANLFKAGTIQIGNPGDSGTTTTIFGDVLVIGQSISGFTSELYIEDNLIELNYNPSASTESTSLGAGWSIQDGSGLAGTNVLWDIRGAATGLANRSFATNLQDIRIRETGTLASPNGLRVIAETDIIDGGSY